MKNLKKIMFVFSLLLVSGAFAESLPEKVVTKIVENEKKKIEEEIRQETTKVNKETSQTWAAWLISMLGLDRAEEVAKVIDFASKEAKKEISPEAAKKEAEEKKKNK